MSFTGALLIILAIAALVLGLTCYHLLSRLEQLERAVAGGFDVPSHRLSREEFEQRFGIALARHRLAQQVGSGVVIALGPTIGEAAQAVLGLERGDGVYVLGDGPWRDSLPPGTQLLGDNPDLGLTARPYALVVDQQKIRAARPVANGRQLLDLLAQHT